MSTVPERAVGTAWSHRHPRQRPTPQQPDQRRPTLPRISDCQEVAPPLKPPEVKLPPPSGSLDVPRSVVVNVLSPREVAGLEMGATDGIDISVGRPVVRPVTGLVPRPVLMPDSGSVVSPRPVLPRVPIPVSMTGL